MTLTTAKHLRSLAGLITVSLQLLPVSSFGLALAQTGSTNDPEQERFPPTWAIKFVCDESGSVPTLVVHTRRHSLQIAEWRSDYFQAAGYDPLTRCRKVAERLRLFYNCGLLRSDNMFSEISTTPQGNPSPVLFVGVDDEARRRCPTLDQRRSGKLLLFMVEPNQNLEQIQERLRELGEGRPESLGL
jgi:hypothetical protein